MSRSGDPPEPRPDGNSLSDEDISLLSDIGEFSSARLDAEQGRRLERLIARGFVEPADAEKAPARYQLTGKAQKFLSERGEGLNEA